MRQLVFFMGTKAREPSGQSVGFYRASWALQRKARIFSSCLCHLFIHREQNVTFPIYCLAKSPHYPILAGIIFLSVPVVRGPSFSMLLYLDIIQHLHNTLIFFLTSFSVSKFTGDRNYTSSLFDSHSTEHLVFNNGDD